MNPRVERWGPVPGGIVGIPRVSPEESASRTRWPFVLLVVLCATALVAVLTGVPNPLSAAQFANTGHWVYNSALHTVFHIDGATPTIDAQLALDAAPGSQVLQGDLSGYVVGPNGIIEFDKASLTPQRRSAPPADEFPLGIEVVGGPYAIYRNAGKIVRLGDPTATISAGGAIGDPVVTDDGTLWFHRTGAGSICRVDRNATEVSGCPVSAPKDHAGALTVLDGQPAFVDLFTSRLHTIDGDTLGPPVPLGVPLSPNSRPATQDADSRLVILDPGRSSLILVDLRGEPAEPVTVALPSGDYDGPVSTGEVIALVDRQKGTVLTFTADGERKDSKPIREKSGTPRLSRGEDERVYVEDADGTQVLVVAENGSVQDVPVTGKPTTTTRTTTQPADERDGDTDPSDTAPDVEAGRPAGSPPGTDPRVETPPPPPPPVEASRPGAPLAVSAQPGDRSAVVRWGAAPDNRAPVTAYAVTWQAGSVRLAPSARLVTVDGLTNGVSYTFTVTATNRIGTGPGASSGPVTPFAAAAAPEVSASRQNGAVDVSWSTPDLRGGNLVHYLVSATGLPNRTVPGTSSVYNGIAPGRTVTFTVRAVTRTGGRTANGAPGSASVTIPEPSISIAQGEPSETENCEPPDCHWVNATMTGFSPNTRYKLKLSSEDNDKVEDADFTTDANGDATYNELNYDVPGNTVWVSVSTPNGLIRSNEIVWR